MLEKPSGVKPVFTLTGKEALTFFFRPKKSDLLGAVSSVWCVFDVHYTEEPDESAP